MNGIDVLSIYSSTINNNKTSIYFTLKCSHIKNNRKISQP